MAKKRGAKRKTETVAAVENENDENHDEEQEADTVENGVATGSSKSTPAAKKKKSVTAKAETNNKEKAKSSKSNSDDEDEKDYEVDKIIDVNYKSNGKREFLIRWKNYSSKHDTWEPEDNLSCDELIQKFLAAQEQRDKQRKELRERPKAVSRYTAPGGRKSKRTAGNRKSYTEKEDDSD